MYLSSIKEIGQLLLYCLFIFSCSLMYFSFSVLEDSMSFF